MKDKLDVDAILNHICNVEDVTLKTITDIVALKISKGPYDGGAESNITKAEEITAGYISENYSTLGEFHEKLTILDGGIKGIQTIAEKIISWKDRQDLAGLTNYIESVLDHSGDELRARLLNELLSEQAGRRV